VTNIYVKFYFVVMFLIGYWGGEKPLWNFAFICTYFTARDTEMYEEFMQRWGLLTSWSTRYLSLTLQKMNFIF